MLEIFGVHGLLPLLVAPMAGRASGNYISTEIE